MPNSPVINAYQANADRTRGAIIYHTILLERIMDSMIASHFFNPSIEKERDKFFSLKKYIIADRMEFAKKVEVFKELLEADCKQRNLEFIKLYPRFGEDFKEIGNTRNDFAHNLSLMPPEAELKTSEIILYKYRKDDPHAYNIDEINEIMRKLNKYISLFGKFDE